MSRGLLRPRLVFSNQLLAGLVLATGLALTACDNANNVAAAEQPGPKAPPPALVEVAPVRSGDFRDQMRFLGEVRAHLRAELAVGAEGAVETVTVREGDRVAQGTLLVAIDTSLVTARLRSLQASKRRGSTQLKQATRDANRATTLGSGIIPQAEIERERTTKKALQAEVRGLSAQARQAEAELQRHRVEAPFDGVVAARTIDPGDWVRSGQQVLDIVATDKVEVLVGVTPALLAYIAEGDSATLHGPEGAKVEAEIVGIVRALDSKTRTARVRLTPREIPPWLLPGAAVDVAFYVRRAGEGLLVPRDALVSGVTETRVFVMVDGAAKPVVVEVVASSGDEALVRAEGLSPDDRVVTRGNERLRPGQPLKLAEPQEPAK